MPATFFFVGFSYGFKTLDYVMYSHMLSKLNFWLIRREREGERETGRERETKRGKER